MTMAVLKYRDQATGEWVQVGSGVSRGYVDDAVLGSKQYTDSMAADLKVYVDDAVMNAGGGGGGGDAGPTVVESNLGVGSIVPFACSSVNAVPDGWLVCNGSAVSRTSYAALFAVTGTAFGVGNGSTTFNLPNLKGRTIVGFDSGDGDFTPAGKTGGAKTHTLTVAEMPSHTHSFSGASTAAANYAGSGGLQGAQTTQAVSILPTGGSGAHNNVQPYLTLVCIIKATETAGNLYAATAVELESLSWNDATTPGVWPKLLHASRNPDGPKNLGNNYFYLTNYVYAGNNLTQLAVSYTGDVVWIRNRYQGTWSAWRQVGSWIEQQLTVASNTGEALRLRGGTSDHVYLGFYARAANQALRSAYVGFGGSGETDFRVDNATGGRIVLNGSEIVAGSTIRTAGSDIMVMGAGITYEGTTNPGGTPNRIGFRWASPNVLGAVDNVVSGVVGTMSTLRLKAGVTRIESALSTLEQLRPVEFTALDLDGRARLDSGRHLGLVAEEVAAVLPSSVIQGEDGQVASVNYFEIVGLLVAAVQELSEKVAALESGAP